METTVQIIPLSNLAIAFIPVLLILALLYKWSLNAHIAFYSIARMLVQLIIVGYVLVFIFESENLWVTVLIITIMITVSSWIALRTIDNLRINLFRYVFISSLLGGGSVLLLTVWLVLELEPIFKPQYTIPLAGMVFANTMNTMSLALERLGSELNSHGDYIQARNIAFNTSLIPIINTMFAVGIVSLPGMMTGQVLSGISPLIAVRYQILVMCMIFSSCALSTALLLIMTKSFFQRSSYFSDLDN
ncbi:MAG: ABC transporter permease [Gammaproteobacteria bacterium]|nr:ABC transporter permease [Gammaproteobacteria bacterium]